MDDEPDRLGGRCRDHNRGAFDLNVSAAKDLDLRSNDVGQLHLLPTIFGKKDMGARQRLDTLLDGCCITRGVIGPGKADDAIDDCQNILSPVIEFKKQTVLGFFERLNAPIVGDVNLRREIVSELSMSS